MAIIFFHPAVHTAAAWLRWIVCETVSEAERIVNGRTWLTFTPEIVCCPVD